MNALFPILLACGLLAATQTTAPLQSEKTTQNDSMQLGNFSVSLAVKDIKVSKAFYEKLDFKQVGGKLEQNWVVLQNGTTTIGLFQGMFEKNSLTFSPGWDHEKKTLKDFQDVRELQRILKERGLKLQVEAEESTDGPAFLTLVDPDGNPILVDQHVPKPSR
jgi:catechol 2,3-dioxygenase-like lactoylglutathione lyase family enzyme